MSADGTYRDPFLRPQTTLRNKLGRVAWSAVYWLAFRLSPRPLHSWRALLLRCFGARIGRHCHVYSGARIWAPWNLVCDDFASIADGAVVYNVAPVHLRSHAVVSQEAYICTATHDLDDAEFPMIATPVSIGAYAWVCARACVLPGVRVGDGAVLGLGSVASRDLAEWSVHVGVPAKRVRARRRRGAP